MTIGLVQRDLTSVRIIGYIEDTHRTLDWYVAELEKLPYRWGTDFLPHDGRTRNFQTGKSTMEILTGLGRKSVFVQNATGIEEGIRAARGDDPGFPVPAMPPETQIPPEGIPEAYGADTGPMTAVPPKSANHAQTGMETPTVSDNL